MAREHSRLTRYVRYSSQWPARRFRKWAMGRNLDRDIEAVQLAIGTATTVLVFLLIAVAETLTYAPQQVGLP